MSKEFTYWYQDKKTRLLIQIPASQLVIRAEENEGATNYKFYADLDGKIALRTDGQLQILPITSNKIEIKEI